MKFDQVITPTHSWVLWVLIFLPAGCLAGCAPPVSSEGPSGPVAEEVEEVELAPYMGEMQRYSAKLGFAIAARNVPLTEFYLAEMGEVLGELEEIEEHDGLPIAHPSKVILEPAMADLARSVETADWAVIEGAYEVTIEACNRCHLATEHGFIKILPATGPSPFNQDFANQEFVAETP